MKRKKEVKKEKKPYQKPDDLVVNEDAALYVTKSNKKQVDESDSLTEEQKAGLDKAFEEMGKGEYVTMADFKKAMGRWLTK